MAGNPCSQLASWADELRVIVVTVSQEAGGFKPRSRRFHFPLQDKDLSRATGVTVSHFDQS